MPIPIPILPLHVARVAAFIALNASSLGAADWRTLLENSPYGVTSRENNAKEEEETLEFRGVVQEGASILVNVYDTKSKLAVWLPLDGQNGRIKVTRYDPREQELRLENAGRLVSLRLKRSEVSLLEVPQQAQATASVATGDSVSEAKQPATGESAPLPIKIGRPIPTASQALVEEIRRRRALRKSGAIPPTTPFLIPKPPEKASIPR